MKKILLLGLLGFALCHGNGLGAESLVLTPAYVNQLAEEMRTNHPALRAAEARTNAAAAGVAGVRTWQDPKIILGGMAADEMMRAEDGDIMCGRANAAAVGQTRRGETHRPRRTRRRDGQRRLSVSAPEKRAGQDRLPHRLGRTDCGDWSAGPHLAANNGGRRPGRAKAGQATLVDVLQIQNEQAKRSTQLQTDQENLAHDQVSLNRLLNRDLTSPWPTARVADRRRAGALQ